MTKRLIGLDVALLAVLGLLAFQMRREWLAAQAREHALWHHTIKPQPPAPFAPAPKVSPLLATSYALVADKDLFSRDRNPNVIIDVVTPPPPPPVPPFPAAHGVMLWGSAPATVVLSEKPGGPQRGYHPGDRIGEWKIAAVDNSYVVFEWNGQQFKKRLDELLDRTPIVTEAPPAPVAAVAPANSGQSLSSSAPSGVGPDMGGGLRACVAGDKSPAGTILDGMKKVVSETPFGTICRWEKQ